jgi:type III pantothenate kinase
MNEVPGKGDHPRMVAAVDIGNSSINIGFFQEARLLVLKIDTHPLRESGAYVLMIRDFLRQNNLEKRGFGVIISSVVRTHTPVFEDVFGRLSMVSGGKDLMTVSPKMKTDLNFKIDSPEELGTDRLAAAVAAFKEYGGPVAVVDCGTATTISAVDGSANFVGGAIMPGLELMGSSLARGTSKLPGIDLTEPHRALGKDTGECIASGLFYGTAGAVERILTEIEKEEGFRLSVVVTGGRGKALKNFLVRPHHYNPALVLEGLKILYSLNGS